jgi:signal peptidase II
MNKITDRLLCPAVSCAIVLCDQATKFAARRILRYGDVRINDFLFIKYSENTGAAWGMFAGRAAILAGLGICAMLAMVLFRRSFVGVWQKLSAAIIFGGILGNTIDRILNGYVIDFVSVDLKFYRWPTFNVADVALFLGVAILLFTFQKKTQKAC